VTQLQWVVDAYTLGFAALLFRGRPGGSVGRQTCLHCRIFGFAAASLACALAPGPAFSTHQSDSRNGAALLVPSSLAILMMPARMTRACGPGDRYLDRGWGCRDRRWAVSAVLAEWLGWRSIFFVNLPSARSDFD